MKKSIFAVVLVSVLSVSAFADGAPASSGGMFGSLGGIAPLLLIFVFFYLFLLRPQQKKAKDHQNLLNMLKKDDRVITAGGIYGTVVMVRGNMVEVKIADGVNIQVAKPSISSVITPQDETAAQTPEIVKK